MLKNAWAWSTDRAGMGRSHSFIYAVEVWAVAMEYGVASFGLKLSICFNVSFEEIHLAI